MATTEEYGAVAAALEKLFNEDIEKYVPGIFRSRIPADKIGALASQCAQIAVDTYERLHK
jgi:hypothetical protein